MGYRQGSVSVDQTNVPKLTTCPVTQLPEAASLWRSTILIWAACHSDVVRELGLSCFHHPPQNTPFPPDVSVVSRPWPGIWPQIGPGRCHLCKHSLAPAQPTCSLASPFAVHKAQWPLGLLGPVILMRDALSTTQLYFLDISLPRAESDLTENAFPSSPGPFLGCLPGVGGSLSSCPSPSSSYLFFLVPISLSFFSPPPTYTSSILSLY